MRPKVLITNADRQGKVTDGWFVRIGKESRRFTEAEWVQGGIQWVNDLLRLGGDK